MNLRRRVFLNTVGAAAVGLVALPQVRRALAATPFQQPPLPFAEDALAPTISARTVGLHYGKHHAGYFTALNKLAAGTPYEAMQLDAVVVAAAKAGDQKIFNQAAQAWNHDLYWDQLRPGGPSAPQGELAQTIERDLGGVQKLQDDLVAASVGLFGSGWVWIVEDQGTLALMTTSNGDNPLAHGKRALLGIDVWEHAYYLDYENRRGDHVRAVLNKLVNWDVVGARLSA